MKVIDGIPTRLYGVRRKERSIVEFIHKCCGCGLRHDVEISHSGRNPTLDITFTTIRDEEE